MKKIMLMAFATVFFAFTSCSSDDDGNTSSSCEICTVTFEGSTSTTTYCDNEDGTYTITLEDGTETTQDIPGDVSFDEFIASQEQLGDCEKA